jgi:hypothetical protein
MASKTGSPRMLSKDDIWAAKDIEERDVIVPQWRKPDGSPGKVRIRTFSKRQADQMRKRATIKDRFGKETVSSDNLEALLFCEGVIEPKFDVEEYGRLEEKSAVAISLILKAIMDASGLSDLAVSEADKSTGTRSDAPLRVLSGAGAKNDTGGTLATDVGQ